MKARAEPLDEILEAQLQAIRDDAPPGSQLEAFIDANGDLFLDTLRVPESARGEGHGTRMVEQLLRWADEHNLQSSVSPRADPGKKAALARFYKRLGYSRRHYDPAAKGSLIRPAKSARRNPMTMTARQQVIRYAKGFGVSAKSGKGWVSLSKSDWVEVFDTWAQAMEFLRKARDAHQDESAPWPWERAGNPRKRRKGNPSGPRFKWHTYAGGTGAAAGKYGYKAVLDVGDYSIQPFTTKHGRHAGYVVHFINSKGALGGGLWQSLGVVASPNAGKRAVYQHYVANFAGPALERKRNPRRRAAPPLPGGDAPTQHAYRGYLIRYAPRVGWWIEKDGFRIGGAQDHAHAKREVDALIDPQDNPVPSLEEKRAAAKLFERFTGHRAAEISAVNWEPPSAVAVMGELDFVGYTTVRDGKREKYKHRFKQSARPLLCVTHDGRNVIVLGGGRFHFGARGFVDKG